MPASQLTRTLPYLSIDTAGSSHRSPLYPSADPLGLRRPLAMATSPAAAETEPDVVVLFTNDGFRDHDAEDDPNAGDDVAIDLADDDSGNAVSADAPEELLALVTGAFISTESRVQLGVDPLTGSCQLSVVTPRSFRPRHNF
ncbi:hypothetical protein BH10ACT3_BH10ACT3_22860 [soil metagenome]